MTIIRCEYEGVIYDLDVLEEQPIRVDISAIENDAIGEVFGASSQQFTLPGSKKNNRFFKHAYKVGVTNVPGLGESVRASVITNSNTLLEGSLFLEEVVRTPIDGINYNVVIVNDVVSFNESIKTVAVKDLKWGNLTHNFTVQNITGSWSGNLVTTGSITTSAVYYPLIDQGRDGQETTGSLPNVAIDSAETASLGYINNNLTPLKVQQLTPAIQVSTVLDKIFEEGGYTYSSSLQPLFNQLYILPKQTEDLSVKGSGFGGFRFTANKTSADLDFTDGDGYVTASINNETLDEGNAYNTTTYTYTVPTTGTYAFNGSLVVVVDPSDPSPQFRGRIRNITTNFTLASTLHTPTEIESTFAVATGNVNLFAGDKIQLQVDYLQGGGSGALTATLTQGSTFAATISPRNYETGIVQLGEQFDPQTKCIDILKGLIEKFNLVIEPVYTQNKVLKIESYNNWIQSGVRKDWTQKVEKAKRIGLRHPLSDQPKSLIFEDNKDNDKLSKLVIDNAEGYQWGTEIIDAVSDVPQGERKVGSFFAPIILDTIPGSGESIIPQLYKTDDSQVERKTFKFKPRLGYKITGSLSQTSYIGASAVPFQNYATISNYDSYQIVSGSIELIQNQTKNLHYNENIYLPAFNPNATGSITSYQEYWDTYINDLYQDDNRILNLDLEFTPEEIQGIALNDRIFVEDTVYRINKISGYNLVNPDVVNVELIKIKDKISFPGCNFDFNVLEGPFTASGGTTQTFTSGGFEYKSHTFPTNGTFTVTQGSTTEAQILVIGGGGGYGYTVAPGNNALTRWYGGAGGAGQLIYSSSVSLNTGSYDITIGLAYDYEVSASNGVDGGNTIISGSTLNITAYGGGGGGFKADGNDGGSGGGAGPNATNTNPGSAIYGNFGNTGGQETVTHPSGFPSTNYYQGGGGGGAGGNGSNRTGGTGKAYTLQDGTTKYYAFGGTVASGGHSFPANFTTDTYGNGGWITQNAPRPGVVIITYRIT